MRDLRVSTINYNKYKSGGDNKVDRDSWGCVLLEINFAIWVIVDYKQIAKSKWVG